MPDLRTESAAMRLFRKMGMDSVAWSLRRLHCPVQPDALVLEVGSGGNPYARSNVLLDAYEETRERHWVPLKADRPLVLGFVEHLPFRDRAFDFVIASHVLEHSADPRRFLAEIQRVGKAGYIETPDGFFERVIPYRDHRLEVALRGSSLAIRKKSAWIADPDTVELYQAGPSGLPIAALIRKRPFAFHVRYYWQERVDYVLVNPEVDASWEALSEGPPASPPGRGFKARLRARLVDLVRWSLSQRGRNRRIDLMGLLMCPTCRSTDLSRASGGIQCGGCGVRYPVRNGIPAMSPETAMGCRP